MNTMGTDESDLYFEREQTRIKHLVLKRYLQRFARIVGQWAEGILSIDGFCGPWNTASEDFKDSSFAIALMELRAARNTVRQLHHKDLRIECVFLEKDPGAFEKLRAYAAALHFPIVQETYLKRWLRDHGDFINLGNDRAPKIRASRLSG
jgi:three-Cys-motif partner protein